MVTVTAAIPATATLRCRRRRARWGRGASHLRRGSRRHLRARRGGRSHHLWRARLERRTARLRRRTHPAAAKPRLLRPRRDRSRLRARRLEARPFAAAVETGLRAWCRNPRFGTWGGQLRPSSTAADLWLRAWRHDARLRLGLRPEVRRVAGGRAIAAHRRDGLAATGIALCSRNARIGLALNLRGEAARGSAALRPGDRCRA